MFKRGKFLSAGIIVLALSVNFLSGAEPTDTPLAPVRVRTEADVEQGKKNVKNVMEELTALFATDTPPPQLLQAARLKEEPPYCKVVAGQNDRSTIVFRPRYTTVKQMFRTLDSVITGQVYIESLAEQNLLVLSVPNKEIEHYRSLMEAMDVPTPQLLIEAKVVELLFNDGMQRNVSFAWNNNDGGVKASADTPGQSSQPSTGLGTNWAFSHGQNNFSMAFQWLMTAQDAKVLSAPNILVTRNETSRIVTGSDIPIQEANTTTTTTTITTKFKRVGVSLEVEPTVINNDTVTLRVYPSVSNVSSYQTINTGSGAPSYSVPVISIRNIETYLRLHNRQTVMMGGLYSSATSLQQQRIPIVSDIPLIGEFFTGKNYTKEVTQLVFFLKIYILNPENSSSMILSDPDKRAELSENIGSAMQHLPSFPKHRKSIEALTAEMAGSLPKSDERKHLELDRKIDEKLKKHQAGGEAK